MEKDKTHYEELLTAKDLMTSMIAPEIQFGYRMDSLRKLVDEVDLMRHHIQQYMVDMKVWKVKTGDMYPERRIKDIEEFLEKSDKRMRGY